MKKSKPKWQIEVVFTDVNCKRKKKIIDLPPDWNSHAEKNLNPYRHDLKTLSFWNTPLGMMEIKLSRKPGNNNLIPGYFLVSEDIFLKRVKRIMKENKKIIDGVTIG